MQKLKTLFAYDAGNYIYFGIFVILSLLSINSFIGLILLLLHGIYLFRYFRRLFYFSLIVSGVIITSYFVSYYKESTPSPSTVTGLVVDSNQDFFILSLFFFNNGNKITDRVDPNNFHDIKGDTVQCVYKSIYRFEFDM